MRCAGGLSALCVTLLCAAPLAAQSGTPQQTQFWPEIDYFQRLNEYARLFASAQWSLQGLPGQQDEQYGLSFDFTYLRRFIPATLLGAHALEDDRREWAQLRVGYRYNETINVDTATITNRILTELTTRGNIRKVFVADRNGFDWRWIDGVYSTRYRNRVDAQIASSLWGYRLTPYSNCEWAYVLGRSGWSSVKCELGAELPVLVHVSVLPYFGILNTWQGNRVNTDAFGLTIVASF